MTISIPANDHGQLRVFATDDPLPAAALNKTSEGLMTLFGAALDPTYVDVVRIADLADMTLSAYIAEGYDMTADLADQAALDRLTGTAILVLSRATGGEAATLQLASGLNHVTTYSPDVKLSPPAALPDASAKGTLDQPPQRSKKSDARVGGMIAMYALIGMFALVGLMIWVGG
ncbi:hypothetical protein [Yoonia sp. BS5-3]|uniref:Uncharacterized protein n=1 Tax=Yoonia phaeophyticola TaxID=3137369 RepID=A0ABZ2VBA8_9RHOB